MQLYSCKVRLKGSLLHEVFKPEVTIPEMIVLRHVHQGDNEALADIRPLGREAYDVPGFDEETEKPKEKVLRTDTIERARLKRLYDPREKILPKLFGVGQPLPQVMDGIDGVAEPARRRKSAPAPDLAEMTA